MPAGVGRAGFDSVVTESCVARSGPGHELSTQAAEALTLAFTNSLLAHYPPGRPGEPFLLAALERQRGHVGEAEAAAVAKEAVGRRGNRCPASPAGPVGPAFYCVREGHLSYGNYRRIYDPFRRAVRGSRFEDAWWLWRSWWYDLNRYPTIE